MWQKYGGSVQFVAVNNRDYLFDSGEYSIPGGITTGEEALQHFINKHGITFPVIHDPAATPPYDIYNKYLSGYSGLGFPMIFIIGPDMVIQDYDDAHVFEESVLDGMIMDVVLARGPVAVEMVMDVSSSMNSVPSGATDTKFTLMKQAASMITTFLADNAQADDDMGLVWFSDGVTEYSKGAHKLVRIQLNSSDLIDEINLASTGTCTAMGPGLQTAFDTLSAEAAATQKKFVILCTDGIQNIEPNVIDVGGHYEILNQDGWCGPGSSVAAHPGTNITSYGTTVQPIGIGITATYEPLLQGIADQTGGFYIGTNDPATDLGLAYFVELCNSLAAGSPAVVCHNPGVLHAEECETVERFCVNSTARKLTAMLNWQDGPSNSLTFWLRAPDGSLVKLTREMKIFDNYCMATIYLPMQQGGSKLPYVGHWEMIIRGETKTGSVSYHAMVVVEDHETKLLFDFPRKAYLVGDIIPLAISITEAKKPNTNIKEITLERSIPRVPFAELLKRYRASSYELRRKLGSEESIRKYPQAEMQLKLMAMEQDPRFAKLLSPVRSMHSLRSGTLECTKEGSAVVLPVRLTQPGLNSFKVSVRFEAHDGSPICRTHMVSVHVGPGIADPKYTTVSVVSIAEAKGSVAYVTPRNSSGQLLGPGMAHEITATMERKSIEARVLDMADGTYQVELATPKEVKGKKAPLSVHIQGKSIWKGNL